MQSGSRSKSSGKQFFAGKPCVRKKGGAEDRKRKNGYRRKAGGKTTGRLVNKITMKLQADDLIMEALKEDISSEDVSTNAVMKEAEGEG